MGKDSNSGEAGELLRGLLEVWQSGDTTDLKEILHSKAVYEDIPNEHAFSGLEEITGYIGHLHSWATDIHIEVSSIESTPGTAVAEWTLTARQNKPMGDRVRTTTDRRIRLRGITLARTLQGRIIRASDYLDTLVLIRQLGGRVDLPGGATLDPLSVK